MHENILENKPVYTFLSGVNVSSYQLHDDKCQIQTKQIHKS